MRLFNKLFCAGYCIAKVTRYRDMPIFEGSFVVWMYGLTPIYTAICVRMNIGLLGLLLAFILFLMVYLYYKTNHRYRRIIARENSKFKQHKILKSTLTIIIYLIISCTIGVLIIQLNIISQIQYQCFGWYSLCWSRNLCWAYCCRNHLGTRTL